MAMDRLADGQHLRNGELAARAAERPINRFHRAIKVGGELTVAPAVERAGQDVAFLLGQPRPGGANGGELLAHEHGARRIVVGVSNPCSQRVPGARALLVEGSPHERVRGWWCGPVQRQGLAKRLVLASAGSTECARSLSPHTVSGERAKRTAVWLPGANRAQQGKPSLLSDVVAIATAGQTKPPDRVANQRLVAAQKHLLRPAIPALCGAQKRPFVVRGGVASS
jgi:hypothetical protein